MNSYLSSKISNFQPLPEQIPNREECLTCKLKEQFSMMVIWLEKEIENSSTKISEEYKEDLSKALDDIK